MKKLSAIDRSQLAGEYVLGTLRGPARARFERLVEDDPHLWQEVAFWERRLGTLGEALPDATPPARVWHAIEAHIGRERADAPQTKGLWRNVPFWRGFVLIAAGLATALLILALIPSANTDFQAVRVATLQNEADGSAWLVRVAADGIAEIAAVGAAAPPPGRDYELWLLRSGDLAPVSLGLASPEKSRRLTLPASFSQGTGFAVSVEPTGGSPTGAPTWPVLFVGNIVGPRHN